MVSESTNTSENSPLDVSFPTINDFIKEKEIDEERNTLALIKDEHRQLYVTKNGLIYVPVKLRHTIIYYFHFGRKGGH